jgi:hypothetical protein
MDIQAAQICLDRGDFKATVLLARRVLHSVCQTLGAPKGDLHTRLEWLFDQKRITLSLKDRGHTIRIFESYSIHPSIDDLDDITEKDAKAAMDFVIEFVFLVYEGPAWIRANEEG